MIDLTVREIGNEPRILDLDVAVRLGYARPRDIRKVIRRYHADMAQLGQVCATVAQTHENNGLGGRPAEAFYLNRAQALFIVAKSETSDAIAATIEIVRKFDAYERGEIVSPIMVQRIVQETAHLVLAHLGMVPAQIGVLDGKVDRLLVVTNEIAMNRRVTIPVNVVRKHLTVLQEDGGNCPIARSRSSSAARVPRPFCSGAAKPGKPTTSSPT